MRVAYAMLPEQNRSQDRVFTSPSVVIVLDGATAFAPTEISPGEYVDALGGTLIAVLEAEPELDLSAALAKGIGEVSLRLDAAAGGLPSSTVAIIRERSDDIDLLVLGDTQIIAPAETYIDERIDAFASFERGAYRERLAEGYGFDRVHRAILRRLQSEESRHRNVPGGYWIAEASSEAAAHAVTATLPRDAAPWLVAATDGAYRPMRHLSLDHWPRIADATNMELHKLLAELQRWEETQDPDGILLPRSKRSDDKALAVMRFDAHVPPSEETIA